MATKETTKSKNTETNIHVADKQRKALVETYKNEEKETVSISPLYKPYLGNVCTISVNGISVAVPVDGSRHKVPATFADEVTSRIMAVDATIRKAEKMSSVKANNESYPGELKMF